MQVAALLCLQEMDLFSKGAVLLEEGVLGWAHSGTAEVGVLGLEAGDVLVQFVVFSDLLVESGAKVKVFLAHLALLLALLVAFLLASLKLFVGLSPIKETGGHVIPRKFGISDLFRAFPASFCPRSAANRSQIVGDFAVDLLNLCNSFLVHAFFVSDHFDDLINGPFCLGSAIFFGREDVRTASGCAIEMIFSALPQSRLFSSVEIGSLLNLITSFAVGRIAALHLTIIIY